MHVFCLSCPSATFALQHGSFVPCEWLAAKGLLRAFLQVHWCAPSSTPTFPNSNLIKMLNCESATLNLYLFIYLYFNILLTYKAYLNGDLDFVKLLIT